MSLLKDKDLIKKIRQKKSSLPITLNLSNIFILPTRYGILFGLIIFAMLIASANYNNNLGFIMTFLLASMAISSIWHTYNNLAGVQIKDCTVLPVFAGELINFELKAQAGAKNSINLNFHFSQGAESGITFTKKENKSLPLQVISEKRGIFYPGILHISSCYPLGLFFAAVNLCLEDVEALVYPSPMVGKDRFGSDDMFGDDFNRASANLDDFKGLAGYRPGDEVKRIYWKAFSRGQGVYVKEFDQRAGEALLLDWYSLAGEEEWKLSLLCYMVINAEDLGIEYSLKLPGNLIDSGRGPAQYSKCLKSLALFNLSSYEKV